MQTIPFSAKDETIELVFFKGALDIFERLVIPKELILLYRNCGD